MFMIEWLIIHEEQLGINNLFLEHLRLFLTQTPRPYNKGLILLILKLDFALTSYLYIYMNTYTDIMQ